MTPRNVDRLHALLSEVMVRNQRSTVGLQFTRRHAQTFRLSLGEAEKALYNGVASFVRDHLRRSETGHALSRMALLVLQQEMGSSAEATRSTLERLAESDRLSAEDRSHLLELAREAQGIKTSAKTDRLLGLLDEVPGKLVVFTQFRGTQQMLDRALAASGHAVSVFHGGLSRMEKERQVERFRTSTRVLLATDSGSEGRNLQFASAICNFDLPWNPMRIEQRIGRLSRIGQTRDVQVFNLTAQDTIESAILHLLEAKVQFPGGDRAAVVLLWDPLVEAMEAPACPGCGQPSFVIRQRSRASNWLCPACASFP